MNWKSRELEDIIRNISSKDDRTRASILLNMLFSHDLSTKEKSEIQEWFQSEANIKAKYEAWESLFLVLEPKDITKEEMAAYFVAIKKMIASRDLERAQGVDVDSGYNEYDSYIERVSAAKHSAKHSAKRPLSFGRIAMRVAAVVIPLMIIGGVWLWSDRKTANNEETTLIAAIYPTANTTITGSAGALKSVILPDSSRVWINSEGTVSYNDDFSTERFVTVDGEAYFSVTKDSARPFRVKTRDLVVQVLGTEFNLQARGGGAMSEITLVSGAVEVITSSNKRYSIAPGQRLSLENATLSVAIDNIPQEQLVPQWRKQRHTFDKAPLDQVLQWIGSYYNMEVVFENFVPGSEIISMDLDPDMTLGQVLEVLHSITDIEHRIEVNNILVTKR